MYSTIKRQIQQETVLEHSDEQAIIDAIRNGDNTKKDVLMKKYMKFVLSIVRRYDESYHVEEDLFQEAMIGFMRAVENYDGTSKLSTYAEPYIRRAIRDHIMTFKNPLKLMTTKSIRKAYFNLRHYVDEKGYLDKERKVRMAHDLNITIADIDTMLDRKRIYFANSRVDDGDEYTDPVDLVECEWNAIETFIEERDHFEKRTLVGNLLNTLPERDKDILMNHYLVSDVMTLDELSQKHGVSIQRIKQLEDKAIKKLQALV